MRTAWRIWVVVLTLLAALVAAFGMRAGMSGAWWPVAGIWLAAGLASFGLSVWVAGCLTMLGILMDFMGEAPLGAWPLALISAYGVAVVAWDRQPPIPVIGAEVISVLGGFIAVSVSLGIAAGVAGRTSFSRDALTGDFIMTALLYPLARIVIIPASIRIARR